MTTSSANPVIIASGLTKEYRDFWNRPKSLAVNDIDFKVFEGEVFGLLGPNGSGKSTTLKMMLGLLYPTRGTVSVFGKAPTDVKTKMRIGYLPEESYLYKFLTAIETLDFFGALFNLSAPERKRRSEQLLEMVGLSHVKHRPVGEFSKGMARRIGLAQAMINDPDLLILDEPTSGLDPIGCKEIKDLIRFLQKRGKTVVISSHLLSDVQDLCDRVLILYGGVIRAEGRLDELLTVSDSSRIISPLLDPEITGKIADFLKEKFSGDSFVIDHPKRTLEEFFLDVVKKAKNENITTYGVRGGGGIAEYLKLPPDAILEKLLEKKEGKPGKEMAVPVKSGEQPALSKEAAEKLEKLSSNSEKETAGVKVAGEDLTEANKKLSSLLSSDQDRKK